MTKAHEAAELFPMMDDKELVGIVQSMKDCGFDETKPIVMLGDLVLDGRNRLRASVIAGVSPKFIQAPTDCDPYLESWKHNGARRDLAQDQKVAIYLKILEASDRWRAAQATVKQRLANMHKDVAASLPREGGKFSPRGSDSTVRVSRDTATAPEPDRVRATIAQATGVSEATVARVQAVAQHSPEKLNAVAKGEIKANRELKNIRSEERKQEAEAAITKAGTLPPDRRIVVCDVSDAHIQIQADSVDSIITDPPYPREYLHTYESLAKFAAHSLKPGGSCLVMVGQSYLPEIINLMTPHLKYQWCFAYLTPGGQSTQLWDRKVNTFWKPLLWFVKGEYDGDWKGDVCKSDPNDNDKRFHHWGQSESGMRDIVERFSKPGSVVCDPFCGGGTTGVVATTLGRKFIGIEIDKDTARLAEGRLAL